MAALIGMGSAPRWRWRRGNGNRGPRFELDDIHKEPYARRLARDRSPSLSRSSRARRPGADLLTAMVAGLRGRPRVWAAATMSLFFRGFHPQGTSGVFVAAATAARALGLNAGEFQQRCIAGSQAGA